MSNELKNCPRCGAAIPDNAPQGLCPKCLLAGAALATETGVPGVTKPNRPPAPSIGQLAPAFPQLEIIELIGQGGMGFVYKARQPTLDRFVALKVLPEVLAADPLFAERFSREGRLLARLNHPNIVAVHDFGVAESSAKEALETSEAGESETAVHSSPVTAHPSPKTTAQSAGPARFFYLMMEYVDGVNLRQAMRAGRFSPEQALSVVPKICDALQYAHDEGVLHRDIKPENILLDSKGRLKIADFGIAKLVGEQGNQREAMLTGTGSALGTPHYMAPEQIERPSAVDHRADIYSLGVVIYEMLTGELPIGRFAPPSTKTSVTEQVDDIVMRALAKERELRQQSATQVKTEVERVGAMRSESVPASSTGATSGTVGATGAFGVVLFYLGLLFSISMAQALRLSDDSAAPITMLLAVLSFFASTLISARGLPAQGWLRGFSVLALVMALPAMLFGIYFVVAMMSERGGWSPAPSEAVFVPAIALGAILLPWASIRLHHAAGARPADRVHRQTGEINPWPQRVFWLIICIIVLPVVLFIVALVVPYLAGQQRGATVLRPSAVRFAPGLVTNVGKLVVIELHVRAGGDGCVIRPALNGNPLTSNEELDLPVLPATGLVLPNRNPESLVHQRAVGVMREWYVPNNRQPHSQRFAFALPTEQLAADAADRARHSLREHVASPAQIRDEIFLFDAPFGQYDAYRGTFRLAGQYEVTVRHSPDELMAATADVSPEIAASRGLQSDVAMLATLDVQVLVKSVAVTNAVQRIGAVATGQPDSKLPPLPRRIVIAELEIHTKPGVPAIGLNFQGADLEPAFLQSVRRPPGGMVIKPASGTHQMAFQLPRAPQPETMMSTTVLLLFPDDTSACEALKQLEQIKSSPVSVVVEMDPRDKQLKLDLFDVPVSSMGRYHAWLVFAQPASKNGLPPPSATGRARTAPSGLKVVRVENPEGSRSIVVHLERNADSDLEIEVAEDLKPAPDGKLPVFAEGFAPRTHRVGPSDPPVLAWTLPASFSPREVREAAVRIERELLAQRDPWRLLGDGAVPTVGSVRHADGWTYQMFILVKRRNGHGAATPAKPRRFEPVAGLELKTSWGVFDKPSLFNSNGWAVVSHLTLGGEAVVKLPADEKPRCRIKLVDGNDRAITLRIQDELKNSEIVLTLVRDKPGQVTVNGEGYRVLFPTTSVGPDKPDTTQSVMVIVTPVEGGGGKSGPPSASIPADLRTARADLAEALTRLGSRHPDTKVIQARIDALEQSLSQGEPEDLRTARANLAVSASRLGFRHPDSMALQARIRSLEKSYGLAAPRVIGLLQKVGAGSRGNLAGLAAISATGYPLHQIAARFAGPEITDAQWQRASGRFAGPTLAAAPGGRMSATWGHPATPRHTLGRPNTNRVSAVVTSCPNVLNYNFALADDDEAAEAARQMEQALSDKTLLTVGEQIPLFRVGEREAWLMVEAAGFVPGRLSIAATPNQTAGLPALPVTNSMYVQSLVLTIPPEAMLGLEVNLAANNQATFSTNFSSGPVGPAHYWLSWYLLGNSNSPAQHGTNLHVFIHDGNTAKEIRHLEATAPASQPLEISWGIYPPTNVPPDLEIHQFFAFGPPDVNRGLRYIPSVRIKMKRVDGDEGR